MRTMKADPWAFDLNDIGSLILSASEDVCSHLSYSSRQNFNFKPALHLEWTVT